MDVNGKNWNKEVLAAELPVVVDFWHNQCVWCKALAPLYETLSKEYKNKAKFVKLNILESHENSNLAEKYGIMSTPTIKVFCKGQVIGEAIGYMPKEKLKDEIDRILERSEACLAQSTKLSKGSAK
ncbi:MAG: thioredoxin fold domain-containing protein [Candidatus Aenigmarchaeota archaeon]|nr:thioredoxin fold domain-containing protein [Candidatus Aenigmarchaeota archaeon]